MVHFFGIFTGHIPQPRRSSRLRQLSLPKVTVTEPIDLVESEEEDMQSESEQFMAEEHESDDQRQRDDDFEKTTPRRSPRFVEVEEVRKIKFQSIIRYKLKARRPSFNEEPAEDQPAEDQPAEKPKKTKWKRKKEQQEEQNEATKRKKPNVKYPTKKGLYTELDDDLEEIQAARHINRAKEHVKIRNSPRLLSEMLYCLTEEQKQWVEDTGFGGLLGFNLEILPGPFAYNVLQMFEHNSVSLRLSNGVLNICEEDVSDVLGLPHGGDSIMLGSADKYKDRIAQWQSQFSNEDQITTIQVVERMKEPGLTENFKFNFLIVLSNVLIATSTNSYVDKQLLKFDDDVDKCYDYNWAEYLLNSLVSAMESWNRSKSVFFNGSLIFLTLLYVDRVRHKGFKIVERQTPSYKGWTEEKLRERQVIELFNGKFGVGSILPPLRDLPVISKKKSKRNVVDENDKDWNDYVHDQCHTQDWNNYGEDQFKYGNQQAHMQSPTKNGDDGNYHEDEWDAWNYVPQDNSSNGEHKQTEEDNENAEPVMVMKYFSDQCMIT